METIINHNGQLAETDHLRFDNMGRQLLDQPWLEDFLDHCRQLTEEYEGMDIIPRTTPSIVYALGVEIRAARQRNEYLQEATTTDEVVQVFADHRIIPGFLALRSVEVIVDHVSIKPLKKSNDPQIQRFDIRAGVLSLASSTNNCPPGYLGMENWAITRALVKGTTKEQRKAPNYKRPANLLLATACYPVGSTALSDRVLSGLQVASGKQLSVSAVTSTNAFF